jgi:peptide chain release factor 2
VDFWEEKERAVKINQELSQLKEEIEAFDELKKDLKALEELGEEGLEKELDDFKKKLKKKESETFLSGKYDRGDALLTIQAGAGGQDAQDWATMLIRMYERYCQRKGFKAVILHQSFGEGGGPEGRIGTKSATMEIQGKFAFGLLKGESGVHRLVRISPFSPQKLRHTSFALVEVLPEITEKEESEIKIKSDDLRIETFRASGPGGQYVNKRETAVRITHLPTNIKAASQSERSQALNRKKAMKILMAKLYQLNQKEREKELKKIKGEKVAVSWGNQIRSYVLHPYQMVKDLRTEVETSDVEAVLDGDLDKFIEAEIKLKT